MADTLTLQLTPYIIYINISLFKYFAARHTRTLTLTYANPAGYKISRFHLPHFNLYLNG